MRALMMARSTIETETTMTETKTRTITLTGRPPVRIREAEWPIIATAKGDSYSGSDYSRYQQALGQRECDEYSIRVRQHADGRTLVYGVLSAAISAWGQPAHGESHRGGVLLVPAGDGPLRSDDGRVVEMSEIAAAIRRVGEECGIPDAVIRECIADLPAEEI